MEEELIKTIFIPISLGIAVAAVMFVVAFAIRKNLVSTKRLNFKH